MHGTCLLLLCFIKPKMTYVYNHCRQLYFCREIASYFVVISHALCEYLSPQYPAYFISSFSLYFCFFFYILSRLHWGIFIVTAVDTLALGLLSSEGHTDIPKNCIHVVLLHIWDAIVQICWNLCS